MKIGGNKRAREYFNENNSRQEYTIYDTALMQRQIEQFYSSAVAKEYKDILYRETNAVYGYYLLFATWLSCRTEPVPDYSHPSPSKVPKKYSNATAISSDEFFGQGNPKKSENEKSCCCTIL